MSDELAEDEVGLYFYLQHVVVTPHTTPRLPWQHGGPPPPPLQARDRGVCVVLRPHPGCHGNAEPPDGT